MASCRLAIALCFVGAASGCRFELTGLKPGGATPDLSSSDSDLAMWTPSDFAGVILDLARTQSIADLAMAQDMATPPPPDMTTCIPPSLMSTVGPGPNLSITLSNVKLDGGSSFAHVAAGATFTLQADYSITDGGNNIDQILVGIGSPSSTAMDCLFNGNVNHTTVSSSNSITLTAPTTPGTYVMRFHYGQDTSCKLGWWTINGAPTSATNFAAFCVP